MQPDSPQHQAVEASEERWDEEEASLPPTEDRQEDAEQTWFRSYFTDSMELLADSQTVAEYLSNHKGWFRQCALPMQAEPLGENGYDLLIGRFGSFGYLVEARVGLELLPPDEQGFYCIRTIPIPDYNPPGYDVDFQSRMWLVDVKTDELFADLPPTERSQLPDAITSAKWELNLSVGLRFPKFIRNMSEPLIQKTGDRVLESIVRQVNRRLTYKTQLTFHKSFGIPFPKKLHLKKG